MPPKLTSKQMFLVGLVLSAIGIVARVFGSEIALLTLGLVLVAVSPLARLVEQPRKRPDDTTLLIRDTLARRSRRAR